MKTAKLTALLLALVMIFSMLSACSSKETPDPSGTQKVSPTPSAKVSEEPDELIEINYWGVTWNDFATGAGTVTSKVEDAINAITEAEIGVHINFSWVGFADYATQITLAIANNESIDLASYYYRGNIAFVTSNSAAMDITDLLNEHAKETMDNLGWIMGMTTFGGRIYGVPNYRQLNANQYAIFRADNLKQAGVYDKAANMTTWSEFEEVIAEVTEKCDTYGIGQSGGLEMLWSPRNIITGDAFADTIVRDYLGDSVGVIAVDDDGNVASAFDDERSVEGYKLIADWHNKGYVYPESAYSTENNKTLLGMNVYGSLMTGSEYGVEANYRNSTGTECLCVKLWSNPNSGSAATFIGAFVPVTSGNPEAAVKLINLIWNSPELCNLWAWGIEGETYIVEDGIAKYPEGKDAISSGYHQSDFAFANQFLMLPWEGSPADFRELALADMNSAPVSKYAGFVSDLSDVSAVLASLSAIKTEYLVTMGNGMYTDEIYDEFLKKLDSSGMDEYVQTFQSQLDEFMS